MRRKPLQDQAQKRIHERLRVASACLLITALLFPAAQISEAYSVLSHEALVDAAWEYAIRPALLERFPNTSAADLKKARAYAYGGCTIQDIGYYPFGSLFFSDLAHYVRAGDFIEALIRDSRDVDEYAFGLAALAHYAGDNNGHRYAVNRAVAVLYPKLRRKYGETVTYDEDPVAHLKTEFGFDVLAIAKGQYASSNFHDFVGFEVPGPLLEKAVQETYALDLKALFVNYDLAIGSYRHGLSRVVPEMTEVAWRLQKKEIEKEHPGLTKNQFLYRLSRTNYEKEWGNKYQRPTFKVRLLTFLLRIVPKIGPLRALDVKMPTQQTEQMFVDSFGDALKEYEAALGQQRRTPREKLANINLDTGTVTALGDYPLADQTYRELLDRLAKQQFAGVSPELRRALLTYFENKPEPEDLVERKVDWDTTEKEFEQLKAFAPQE